MQQASHDSNRFCFPLDRTEVFTELSICEDSIRESLETAVNCSGTTEPNRLRLV